MAEMLDCRVRKKEEESFLEPCHSSAGSVHTEQKLEDAKLYSRFRIVA